MSAAFPAPVHLLRLPLSRSAEWQAATSWLGGRPRLGGRPWPRIGGTPLHFLAQIDLAALARLRPGSGLPGTGALAVFGLCDNEAMYDPARDNCRLVHVPDPAAAPPSAPPDDLAPATGISVLSGLFRHLEPNRREFPRWPVDLIPLDVEPGSADEQVVPAALRGLEHSRLHIHYAPFEGTLPRGPFPFVAHSVALLAGHLRTALSDREEFRRPLVKARDRTAAWLAGNPPPRAPAQQSLLSRVLGRGGNGASPAPPGVDPETYARQHAHMTELLATQTGALEEFDRDEPVFRKVAAALVTWADAVPPASLLDDAEAANLASALDALNGRFRAHWDFTRGKPEALTMASLQWLALGPADRHALIPPAAAAVLDRLFRLPSGGYPTCHRMFTGPDDIHDVGLEDTGQVVLLHLASDALLGLGFGDVNPLTVVIGPGDLAQGRLDRARITAAGG